MWGIEETIITFLERRGAIDPENREVYTYGLDTAIYTFVSTLGLALIGFLFHLLCETLVLIILFYTNQSIGGGYHAKTHMRCFLVMTCGLFFYIMALHIPYNLFLCLSVICSAGIVLLRYPLVLHPNKSYLASKRKIFIKRSRVVLLVQGLIFLLLVLLGFENYVQMASWSLALCAISRIAGYKEMRETR